MLHLVAGVDSSSWTTWIVTERNQISSSVEGMNQGTTTVDLLRMPVFSALVSGGEGGREGGKETVSENWEREGRRKGEQRRWGKEKEKESGVEKGTIEGASTLFCLTHWC